MRACVSLKLSALVAVAGECGECSHLDVTHWFVGCCFEPLNIEAHTFF